MTTARRTTRLGAWFLAAATAALVLAGCGSGSSSSTAKPLPGLSGDANATTAPTTGTTGTTGGSSASDSDDPHAIAAAYSQFFAGSTPADRKVELVQDGSAFASVIQAQAGGAMSQGTTVKVGSVTVTSPTRATVQYTILLGGSPALKNQTGEAVKQHGTWVVGAPTFCRLLTLEQSAPALCKTLS
jgi:hypothetical protein